MRWPAVVTCRQGPKRSSINRLTCNSNSTKGCTALPVVAPPGDCWRSGKPMALWTLATMIGCTHHRVISRCSQTWIAGERADATTGWHIALLERGVAAALRGNTGPCMRQQILVESHALRLWN